MSEWNFHRFNNTESEWRNPDNNAGIRLISTCLFDQLELAVMISKEWAAQNPKAYTTLVGYHGVFGAFEGEVIPKDYLEEKRGLLT